MSTKYMESEFQRDDNNRHQSLRQIHKKHEQGSFLSKLKVLNTIDQTCNSTIETIESQRKIFVLKHVDLDPYATAYTEVKCLLLLQHQTHGILPLLDWGFKHPTPNKPYGSIIMMFPLMDMDLHYFIHRHKAPYTFEWFIHNLYRFVQVIDNVHKQGIIHRDIKSKNILMDSHGNWWLHDFGNATILPKNTHTTLVAKMGTHTYRAPELFVENEETIYDGRVDVWSLGILIYEFLFQRYPFNYREDDEHNIGQFYRKTLFQYWPNIPELAKAHPKLFEFLSCCLDKNPESRYFPDELLELPLFHSPC